MFLIETFLSIFSFAYGNNMLVVRENGVMVKSFIWLISSSITLALLKTCFNVGTLKSVR